MKTRLVFTAYNRPRYFEEVLYTWAQVRGFRDWNPVVFLEPSDQAARMGTLARLAGVPVHRNDRRLGVLTNPWTALDTAFADGADFVVLAEDDLLPSSDALEYFTWAATEHAGTDVIAVCAASLAPCAAPEQEHHVTLSGTFCSQLWGTWASTWAELLRDTWDHDYSSGSPHEAGWDWNIYRRLVPGRRVLHPVASRVTHIGRFGGQHTTEATFPASQLPTYVQHRSTGTYRLVPLREGDAPTP